jgi:hypothetical protein
VTARQLGVAWTAAVAGPLAWFVQLAVGWALVPPAGQGGREGALTVLSLAAFAVAVLAALAGGVLVRASDPGHHARRFVALSAFILGLLSALLIACTALPIWLLGAGAEP